MNDWTYHIVARQGSNEPFEMDTLTPGEYARVRSYLATLRDTKSQSPGRPARPVFVYRDTSGRIAPNTVFDSLSKFCEATHISPAYARQKLAKENPTTLHGIEFGLVRGD